MSKALKCDRCHKCFSPEDIHPKETYTVIRDVISQDAEGYYEHKVAARYEELDLCPACSKAFWNFMDGAQLANETTP